MSVSEATSINLVQLLKDASSASLGSSQSHKTEDLFSHLQSEAHRLQIDGKASDSDLKYLVKDSAGKLVVGSREHRIGQVMVKFDLLAQRLRDAHYWNLFVVCAHVFALTVSIAFSHAPSHQPWVPYLAIAIMVSLFWLWRRKKPKTSQVAFLTARATAEILRIHFFVGCAGQSIDTAAQVQRRFLPVVGTVMAIIDASLKYADSPIRSNLTENDIKTDWFFEQRSWIRSRAEIEAKRDRFCRIVSNSAFVAGLGCYVISALFAQQHPHLYFMDLNTLTPILVSIAGLSEFYRERRGFQANAERYRHSESIYEVDDRMEWPEQIKDVAGQALFEVVDWYVSSIEREIDIPKGA